MNPSSAASFPNSKPPAPAASWSIQSTRLLIDRSRGVTMSSYPPYTDPVLGTSTWNQAQGEWQFTILLPSDRFVEASITPEDNRLHLSSPELAPSRECLRWVRDNEAVIMQ